MKQETTERTPYIIGITGGSASGKTFLLSRLKERFNNGQLCLISQDDYYKPKEFQIRDKNSMINFDDPWAIDNQLFFNDISLIRQGITVTRQEYSFNDPGYIPVQKEFVPSPVIVIEGLFIFYYREILDLLDLKVFIDASEDIMFKRRMERDEKERGIPRAEILYQWNQHVCPAYKKYLLPCKSEADIIITNNHGYEKSLELLTGHMNKIIYGK